MIYWGTFITVFMASFLIQNITYIHFVSRAIASTKQDGLWESRYNKTAMIINLTFHVLFTGTRLLITGLTLRWMGY